MQMSEIGRMRLQTSEVVTAELPSVREEASTILGYSKPEVKSVVADPLAAAIGKLDLDILDWKDVLRYQFEQREAKCREDLAAYLASDSMPNDWSRHSAEWTETPIAKYTGYIPDHVLQKALEIKREVPEVGVYVESLERDRDPFMFVRIGDHWDGKPYYIEVWNEPGFEHSR